MGTRELARYANAQGIYDPVAGHQQPQRKKAVSLGPRKLVGALKNRVISHLQEHWSPEQIAGRLRLEGIIISHKAIYQFIWAEKKAGGLLYKNLRQFWQEIQETLS
jgi:IS30 family transposase